VKGEEPEKTNYFLQAFYKAAISGKDYSKFIAKYLDHRRIKNEQKKIKEITPSNNTTTIPTTIKPIEIEPKNPKKDPTLSIIESNANPKKPSVEAKKPVTEKPKEVIKTTPTVQNSNSTAITTGNKNNFAERPKSTYKRPDRNPTEVKEMKEEENKNNKAPQGLISDKGGEEEEEGAEKVRKEKDEEDFGSTKQSNTKSGGMKLNTHIFKHRDVIEDGESKEKVKKSGGGGLHVDLESIKSYVQEITKNSNPIGKIIEYLGDDIESMNKELGGLIKESKMYKEKYEEEIK
jgi:TRAF3-interacting protein 1